MNLSEPLDASKKPPQWRSLKRAQRRVVGVMVEKAKTTPDQYPMSLNAITTGCNQKSNRSPLMNMTPEEVQDVLDQLREVGAVVEVHSGGRVPKYKHLMYEWLGVDKVELAVMTELLLRGEQSLGDLRGRAARMEPIASVSELTPIVNALVARNLILELSPPGRGQMVSHNLYEAPELDSVRKRVAEAVASEGGELRSSSPSSSRGTSVVTHEMWDQLQQELAEIRAELQQLKSIIPQ